MYSVVKDEVDSIIVDFHAEATAEKRALGWYLDGRASLVYGTHTHVQTADEEILPGGTGYISDIGMKKEQSITKLLTQTRVKFEVASGNPKINENGKTESILRVAE
ncbi:MAG: YmdB family metallophosphoesterase [bacterium]|nr:YmdB family metallophosphoesterase [bacterium]